MKKILFIALLLSIFTSSAFASSLEGQYSVMTDKLGSYETISNFTYSPDRKSFAFEVLENNKRFVVKDGVALSQYESSRQPTYSSDGKSFAFSAFTKKGWVIVKDGVEISGTYPTYSPDGGSFAFVSGRKIIKDNVEMYEYKENAGGIECLALSNEGKRLANCTLGENSFMFDNGVKVNKTKFDNILYPTYSPDGKSFAFIGLRNIDWWYVVKDGIEINKSYGRIAPNLIKFSPDSKSFAYTATIGIKGVGFGNFVVKDGIKSKVYLGWIESLTYSPDSKHFAFVGIDDNGKYILSRDGIESEKYDFIGSLTYSPDSKSFSFVAKKGDKWFIMKDGVEMSGTNPIYSPDGKSFILVAKKDSKWFIMKDGVESTTYDMIRYITYLPDGKGFSFLTKKDGEWLMVKYLNEYQYLSSKTVASLNNNISLIALHNSSKDTIAKLNGLVNKVNRLILQSSGNKKGALLEISSYLKNQINKYTNP